MIVNVNRTSFFSRGSMAGRSFGKPPQTPEALVRPDDLKEHAAKIRRRQVLQRIAAFRYIILSPHAAQKMKQPLPWAMNQPVSVSQDYVDKLCCQE